MTRARWLAVVVLVLAAIFAWKGGVFSTADYFDLTRKQELAEERVTDLRREVDSLRRFRDSLAASPAVQERVAREQWGMVRPGELTFTITPTDSAIPDTTER